LQRDIKTVDFPAKVDTTMLTKYVKVANNNIIYPIHAFDDIENLFRTRHKMYKKVYLHPNVTSVEYLITEIMIELNKIMELSSSINDMDKFITLNDNTIIECVNVIEKLHVNLTEDQIMSYNKIKELKRRLDTRDFYHLLCSITTKEKLNTSLILESLNLTDFVIFANHKIGFLSGNKPNPFEHIYFFDPSESPLTIGTLSNKGIDIPVLASTGTHQEFVTNFYFNGSKDSHLIPELEEKLKSVLIST
jgi:HD superfamily phosphohydrolase